MRPISQCKPVTHSGAVLYFGGQWPETESEFCNLSALQVCNGTSDDDLLQTFWQRAPEKTCYCKTTTSPH